ncbi:IS21 family transposase [Plantactinospora sp. CA-294935]|uniref:IS21 family transposase n=1 Tax=Plantactinospora sp. CA-294935 TaxID=3240012 RepID=UPI003D91936D
MLSRVEVFERIRRDRRLDPQVSVRELSERHGVHRRTVRQALSSAVPPPRKGRSGGRPSVLAPAKDWIDAMLREDLRAPRKQRHTVERIRVRLRVEHGFDAAAYSTVAEYVARRRGEIEAEARQARRHLEGTVPQLHEPGAEAEVDFADVWVRLAGEPVKCHLFTLRLSYSGKAVHRVFASEAQEAFMEGHVEAFRVLGGVPTRHIRYDNLKPAVNRVCFGRTRIESQRWVAFRSHYGFDAFYCLPGVDGAHEKGGVEQEGGRFRRTHLVPVPEVDTLAELNERIAAIDAAEDGRQLLGSPVTIGFNFAVEADRLTPLPAEDFDCGITLTPTVRRDSRIVVRQSYYSVPARFIGRQVRVSLRANELVVFDRHQVVARHPRITRRYHYRDDLDHYLEILLTKPGAFAGSTALAQARAEGTFTAVHDAFWAAARAAHGEAHGTRALVEVLLLHRRMPATAVLAGITAALEAGSTSPDVVAIEARKADRDDDADAPVPAHDVDDTSTDTADAVEPGAAAEGGDIDDEYATVISLPTRRPVALPEDTRPIPSVAVYDQLLSRTPKGNA